MTEEPFRDGLVREMPNLRAFAVSLCGSFHLADDLVQETLVKAWTNEARFEPGTNLRAWLFTILRNVYYSHGRRQGAEVEDAEGEHAARLAVKADQDSRLELEDFRRALAQLPDDQREALILVGASGLSYEEAAAVCGAAVGTIKSRVNRARARLAELLNITCAEDIGMDRRNAGVELSEPWR
jgi:RNA polymerase sigma-70 factor (ECF subfamily)